MLEICQRYNKALHPNGLAPTDAPDWIDDIDNPYIQGLFAPICSELESQELKVEGELPKDLCGAYFRNGPSPKHKPLNRYHWFDGDGVVHGLWFDNGQVRYRNRWVQTRGLKHEAEQQQAVWPGVLGPFDFSLPGGPLKDTANTDLIYLNNQLLALWYESGALYALDPESLETCGLQDFGGRLKTRVSAHSKLDPNSGDFIFFNYGDKPPYMQYGVLKADGDLHCVDIELPGPRRPHDIGVTPNYSILHDFPVFYDPEFFKKTGKRIPFFHPEVPTRYGVIPRFGKAEDVRWFEFEPCYMLHVVNCWEDGDWLTMVGCRTAKPVLNPDPRDGKLAAMLSFLKLQANLYVWTMNLRTGETEEYDMDGLNAEFPMINQRYLGRKNRYSYHQHIPYEIPATFDGLVKYDLDTGVAKQYAYGPKCYGSEAPFAPRLNSRSEDDGYVLSFVTNCNDWSSACWIFDAQDIEAGPRAKVHLPHRLSAGFHSIWVPASAKSQ